MKTCNVCRTPKPLTEFNAYKGRSRDGKGYTCRACVSKRMKRYYKENKEQIKARYRDWCKRNPERVKELFRRYHLRAKYGISPEEWRAMWMRQKGQCGLCRQAMQPRGKGRLVACVDHDHLTGKVRGLLHSKCNSTLGNIERWPVGALEAWISS